MLPTILQPCKGESGHTQKYALLKNPLFLFNPYETWSKLSSHEFPILTKFCDDLWIFQYFWVSPDSPLHECRDIHNYFKKSFLSPLKVL